MFIEYIESLFLNPDDKSVIWDCGSRIDIDDTHNIVIFLQVMPNQCNDIVFTNTKPINIFVCNTEQMSNNLDGFIFNIKPFYEYVKTFPNIRFGIIDYSQQNIKIIEQNQYIAINHISTYHIPYQYRESDIQFLKSVATKEKKFFMCGGMSERRTNIITDMMDNGIKITPVNGFHEQRDRQMMQYKIMINICTHDSYTIYEHIRCDRLIFAGMVIVSEHKTDDHTLDIYDLVVWCNKEEFPINAWRVLKNYDYYQGKISADKIKNIADTRRSVYLDFRSKYDKT